MDPLPKFGMCIKIEDTGTTKLWKVYYSHNESFWAKYGRCPSRYAERSVACFLWWSEDEGGVRASTHGPGLEWFELHIGPQEGSTWAFLSNTGKKGKKMW